MRRFLEPQSTLIIANGERPARQILDYYRAHSHTVIALDGAADWLMQQKIIPDIVIGDMDSAKNLAGLNAVKIAEQNSNDLEKALRYCLEQGLHDVAILGAFGMRIDHFLTNLYVLKKYAHRISMIMHDEHQCAFMCPINEEIIFPRMKGSFISLFPLLESVGPITSTGVEYPLFGEILSLNSRLGTLNKINSDEATLLCEHGDLLVVVPA